MELNWFGDLGNSALKLCAFRNETPGPVKRFEGKSGILRAARWLKSQKAARLQAICANPKRARELARTLAANGVARRVIPKKRFNGLRFLYDFQSLGMDRLADAVAARADYPDNNLLVLDFGTALTVNVIEGGVFTGGFIVPGHRTLLDSLSQKAPALPRLAGGGFRPVMARTTRDAITTGAHLLFTSGVTGLLVWILRQRKKEFRIIATGGGAAWSSGLPFPVTRDATLTLRGVKRLAAK